MAYNYEYPYTDPNRYNSDWLLSTVKKVIDAVNSLEDWKKTNEDQYNEIMALYNDIIAGKFPESVENAFREWMQKNAYDLVGELVKNVFFGLTDSGYFVAYIPESWDDIIFKTTGLDIAIADVDYGHLILLY